MKRIFSLLLVFALVLSMGTTALATEGIESGEQPQEEEQQTTVTVGTLDELIAAIAAAEDGDTIAISAEIKLDGVTLETEKDITLVRADTYESGSFLRLKNGTVLSGFTIENNKYYATIVCKSSPDSAIQIKECTFIGDGENTKSFVEYYSGLSSIIATISNCSFSGARYSAVMTKNNVQLTITECTFDGNYSYAQGGAIHSSGKLILTDCSITNNSAASGGGVYSNGNLIITNCQFSGNSVESEKFGTDVFSNGGTLTITDSQTDGEGYYEESTGEKVTLPLTDYANTAKLIWLTDEQAAEYFAPIEDAERVVL